MPIQILLLSAKLCISSGDCNKNTIDKNKHGGRLLEQSRAEQSRAEQSRAEQSRAEQSRAEQYLSASNTKSSKGVFAICVLLHHLFQYSGIVDNRIFAYGLQSLGYLSVGMFFFYTGYGLMLSSKKSQYLTRFLRKRVLALYAFYVILILLYGLYEYILGVSIDSGKLIQSFLFGATIVPLAWYLQVTILIYLLYWIVFKIVKKDAARIGIIGISLILYCLTCHFCGLSSTWYESIFCMLLGMMWFWKKDKIDEVLNSKRFLLFIVSAILFCIFTVLQLKLGVIPKMLSAVSFAITVTTFTYMLSNTHIINNCFTQFLGKYSLEIYVCQGFFLLLRKPAGILSNPYIFIVVTIVGTVAVAMVMKPIYETITRSVRKILKVV